MSSQPEILWCGRLGFNVNEFNCKYCSQDGICPIQADHFRKKTAQLRAELAASQPPDNPQTNFPARSETSHTHAPFRNRPRDLPKTKSEHGHRQAISHKGERKLKHKDHRG